MAGDHLIAAYAGAIGVRLGPDIAIEVLDHLAEATGERVAAGAAPDEAAAAAIAAFGTPDDLAATFVSAGVGLPTRFTRIAGRALSAAAVLLAVSLATLTAAHVVEAVYGWGPLAELVWSLGAVVHATGLAMSTLGSVGMVRRARGLSPVTIIAIALVALTAVGGLATWFVFGWGTTLALGIGAIAIRSSMSHLPPTRATSLMATGALTVGVVPWTALTWMGSQDVVESVVVRAAMGVGLVLLALGLWEMGRWLTRDGSPPRSLQADPEVTGPA